MKQLYITSEIFHEICVLQNTFHIVRLVDPIRRIAYQIKDPSSPLIPCEYICQSVLEKGLPCKECIPTKAVKEQSFCSKFKMVGSQFFYVCAKYVQVDGHDLALQMIGEVTNDTMPSTNVGNEFLQTIHELNHSLYRDELTNVYNRRYFNEKLPILLHNPKEQGVVAIAIIDIDNFKVINDTYGHLKGDDVIQILADTISSCISTRKGDFIVRFGGDEFIIVYKNITSEGFENRLQELISKTRDLIYDTNQMASLSVSIGGAFSTELEVISPQGLIDLADKRLYLAKEMGKNQAVLQGDNMHTIQNTMSKNTVRRIDNRGRIMIPLDVLQSIDIDNGDEVDVTLQGNKIVLTKRRHTCILCGSRSHLELYNGKCLCGLCRQKLATANNEVNQSPQRYMGSSF